MKSRHTRSDHSFVSAIWTYTYIIKLRTNLKNKAKSRYLFEIITMMKHKLWFFERWNFNGCCLSFAPINPYLLSIFYEAKKNSTWLDKTERKSCYKLPIFFESQSILVWNQLKTIKMNSWKISAFAFVVVCLAFTQARVSSIR